jgi:hypothetical protein
VEILRQLYEAVHRERPGLWLSDWILCHDSAPSHGVLSVKQFLAQKLITEMEHLPCSPHLALNDLLAVSKSKVCLKGMKI